MVEEPVRATKYMKTLWLRFTAALGPGVRALLSLLTAVYFLALAGHLTRTVDLYRWLPASAPQVCHGQIWRLVTYALLPAGLMDFVMNLIALVLLGALLERHWTRGELWWCSSMAALGGGLAALLLWAPNSTPLTGAAPAIFGLLIAWAFICGRDVVLVPVFGQVTVRQLVSVFAVVSLLGMFFSAGKVAALTTAAGGLAGWLYLWLRQKWLLTRTSRTFQSERINRLEL